MNASNRKVAIGFIVFYPGEKFINRIILAETLGFKIYIFDNSPKNSMVRDLCKIKNNCNYFSCGKNVGIGFGLSCICAQAYYDSYPALLYFDQDTIFNHNTLDFIEKTFIENPQFAQRYSAIVFNSKKYIDDKKKNIFVKDVLLAISSGSLFFLDNLNKSNWHNEKYFVDCVDYEFCLRSNINNYKIGECSITPGFNHEIEQPDLGYSLFGKTRLIRKYSSRRIISATISSVRLIGVSIKFRKFDYSIEIFRSIALYLWWQLIVRIINLFGIREK